MGPYLIWVDSLHHVHQILVVPNTPLWELDFGYLVANKYLQSRLLGSQIPVSLFIADVHWGFTRTLHECQLP